ncbi:hypothetical protein Tco_1264583 [Tanacetum coccineum]
MSTIPSPLFPASPPASPIRTLGYRAAMIRLRAETLSTSHSLPLPTSSPPLQLLSSDYRTDRPKFTTTTSDEVIGIDLGLGTEVLERVQLQLPLDRLEVVGQTMGLSVLWIPRSDDREPRRTRRISYDVIEYSQDRRPDISECETLLMIVTYHYETARLLVRRLWFPERIGDAADRYESVVTLEMLQADYQRQVQLAEALKLLKGLQTQMVEFQRQHGPAKGPAQPDAPGEAENGTKEKDHEAMINEGVTAALVARDATRNGDDSHTSGTGAKRPVQVARECTYPDFLKSNS